MAQLIGGHFADRGPLKLVYVAAWAPQIVLLWIASAAGGAGLVLIAALIVSFNAGSLPAENLLLARYAPARRHGLAFGAKFVLAFGAGPAAIELVAWTQAATGGFAWLFIVLAACAAAATGAAVLLPGTRVSAPIAVPAAGE